MSIIAFEKIRNSLDKKKFHIMELKKFLGQKII